MDSELKYIVKGVLYTSVLIAVIYTAYYIISDKKASIPEKPQVITQQDLFNMPEVANGKKLFESNCSACHKLHETDEAWNGIIIHNGYNKKELYAWIRNSDSVIKSGNKYYNALFDEYNKIQMTSFPNLTDEEIEDILDYIKVEETFKN